MLTLKEALVARAMLEYVTPASVEIPITTLVEFMIAVDAAMVLWF
jgi:hypothetical protein